jgi:hypothetical protein
LSPDERQAVVTEALDRLDHMSVLVRSILVVSAVRA